MPAVAAVWLAVLWMLGLLLAREPAPPVQTPIDATLIELPGEPTRAPQPQIAPPAPAPRPKPTRAQPRRAIEQARPVPAPEQTPAREQSSAPPESPAEPAPPPPAAPSAAVQPQRQSAAQTGRTGARALFNPLPQIPDELRERASSAEALARFDIRADGTVSVELVKPTPDPLLNRVILDTLRTWRFFPATENGRPVASTQEIRIRLEVR